MHYRQSKAPRPVLITKAIAERHAALPMLGMDRKLNPVRLGAYVKMIEAGVMSKTSQDTLEDFVAVYDFAEAFHGEQAAMAIQAPAV